MADWKVPDAGADPYCSLLAREGGESIAGTAVHATRWILLEYTRPWRARATEDNELPPAVKHWLAESLGNKGRLQFIRQTASPQTGFRCFIVLNQERHPIVYRFKLNSYDDLFRLDWPAISAADPAYAPFRHNSPLYIVCTNGKRDRCCARFGAALYRQLAADLGEAVWQTTHLGGHRFAPTLVTFPDGTCYGHLTPDDAAALPHLKSRDMLMLDRLRGRTCYTPVVQSADYHLRRLTGRRERAHFQHTATFRGRDEEWIVHFMAPLEARTYQLRLQETAPREILASCGAERPKAVGGFELIDHVVLGAPLGE